MGPGSMEKPVSVSHLHGLLVSVGQEPDFSRDEVFIRRFPIHRACRDGDVGALVSLSEQLPDQAPLTAEDSCYGWTPLHWAAHTGQLECVVRLVQMGCEVNSVTSRFNQTPTHTAAFGGHPKCLVWLTQAGADVNRQDFVGEAPIHKAARSGSLECVQVLLIAGAKPHLRNASGQTAADLAHAHGFLDCSHFISDAQTQLQQLSALRANGDAAAAAAAAVCGQRKRLLAAVEPGHVKRAKRADNVLLQMFSAGEEVESMNIESVQELSSDDDAEAFTNGHHHHPHLHLTDQDAPVPPKPLPSANQQAAAAVSPPPSQRRSADMCGSLHLSGSPSSCVSQRPAWWGLMGAELGDFQQYGHYHGFGDTAEELESGGQDRHKPAASVPLYH